MVETTLLALPKCLHKVHYVGRLLCGNSVREISDILQKSKSTVNDVIVKWDPRGSESAEKTRWMCEKMFFGVMNFALQSVIAMGVSGFGGCLLLFGQSFHYPPTMNPSGPGLATSSIRKEQWHGLATLVNFLPYGITDHPLLAIIV
ncbi:hypothetical protein TNCV_2885391 [Trichonephila clavipes]|nr:hypothetical protein TNCV_2885391 [Trichonephila clavipes]